MKTQRQTWEESFWHRLAYHCAREFEEDGGARGTFHPAIDEASGRFTFTYRRPAASRSSASPCRATACGPPCSSSPASTRSRRTWPSGRSP